MDWLHCAKPRSKLIFPKQFFAHFSPPVSGTDYIYMNSAVYRNGTSFVESLFETFGEANIILFLCICIHTHKCELKCKLLSFIDCKLGDLKDVTDDLEEDKNTQDDTLKLASSQHPSTIQIQLCRDLLLYTLETTQKISDCIPFCGGFLCTHAHRSAGCWKI